VQREVLEDGVLGEQPGGIAGGKGCAQAVDHPAQGRRGALGDVLLPVRRWKLGVRGAQRVDRVDAEVTSTSRTMRPSRKSTAAIARISWPKSSGESVNSTIALFSSPMMRVA
jgi:hypothetical protein